MGPYRANYPNRYMFFSVLANEPDAFPELPTNLPTMNTDSYSKSGLNFTLDYIRYNLSMHPDRTLISPSDSIYWGSQNYVNLPFLPYFSNCQVMKNYNKI